MGYGLKIRSNWEAVSLNGEFPSDQKKMSPFIYHAPNKMKPIYLKVQEEFHILL